MCVSEIDRTSNWDKVLQALKDIGIQAPLKAVNLVNPSFKDLMLFCL